RAGLVQRRRLAVRETAEVLDPVVGQRGVLPSAFLVVPALEVLAHRVGVEVGAVVELHALPQVEGPGLAVRAVLPALGELRLHLRGARLETDQPLHDLPGDPEGLPVGGVERVEQVGGTRCTEGEGAAFAGGTVPLGLRTSRQRRQQRQSDAGGHQSAARPRTRRHPGSPHSTTSVVTGSESAVRLTRKRPSGRGSGVTTWFPGSAEQSTRSLQAGRTRHRSGPRSGGKSPKPAYANR